MYTPWKGVDWNRSSNRAYGAESRTWTHNLLITNQLLYQLSYFGMVENRGVEPLTSTLQVWRSPNWTNSPWRSVRDSNPWPPAWQAGVLTSCTNEPLERMKGIEPSRSAWKAEVLPLNYIRISERLIGESPLGPILNYIPKPTLYRILPGRPHVTIHSHNDYAHPGFVYIDNLIKVVISRVLAFLIVSEDLRAFMVNPKTSKGISFIDKSIIL